MQRLLVERGGANCVDAAAHCETSGKLDVAIRRIAGHRGKFAPRKIGRNEAKIDAINNVCLEGSLFEGVPPK